MSGEYEVDIDQEIENVANCRPHVVLLGAGATRASIPDGDRNGRSAPLMHEIANKLGLTDLFTDDLQQLAGLNFESAYSQLSVRDRVSAREVEQRIAEYFQRLHIPESPTLFDYLNLCLREKDVIATFNWDSLLVQSQVRLRNSGVVNLPRLQFLHGNVSIGFCSTDHILGVSGGAGLVGRPCSKCGEHFTPSRLLYPVANKNYADDSFISQQWKEVQIRLEECMMFTVFGYSAPHTDVAAMKLLKEAWGDVSDRMMEQIEIIDRPGADHDELRRKWNPFIHTHHVDIFDSFFDSWIANHPRRTIEAHRYQYFEGLMVNYNPVPQDFSSLQQLIDWFSPLLDAESRVPRPDHRANDGFVTEA
jgi:hypothetical protein